MKSEIHIIAEAVLANIRVLEMLINKLPDADRVAVAEQVKNTTPAPAPVASPAPEPVPVVAPTPAPIPVVTTSVVAAAPAPVKPTHAPFTTQKEMVGWIMGVYQAMGPTKGGLIQGVLDSMGIKNISDVKADQYQSLFERVEALK